MSIADPAVKEEVENTSQDRIAHITMEPGHRAGTNSSSKPIPHHKVISATQSVDKGAQLREVIGVIGVAHNDITPAGGLNARAERMTIATSGYCNDPRAMITGNLLRAVIAAVICNNHFATDA